MLDNSTVLRDAYLTALADLELDGVPIPVYDEALPVTGPVAQLTGCVAYVLLKNQTSVDISPDCQFQTMCSIQVDIVTKFALSQGGKVTSERIANEVLQAIYPTASGEHLNVDSDFNILSTKLEMNKGLPEWNKTNTVFRKQLLFNHIIQQLTNA